MVLLIPHSAQSSLSFGVHPKLYDAPRRKNHDAERRATNGISALNLEQRITKDGCPVVKPRSCCFFYIP